MKTRHVIASAALIVLMFAAVVSAHSITVQGTVVAIEATRLQVKSVDAAKKELTDWYAVDRDTLVKRGTKTVKFADAKIAVGERVVIVVDEHAATKNLAEEIRLAAAK